jgi:hypothetical protein
MKFDRSIAASGTAIEVAAAPRPSQPCTTPIARPARVEASPIVQPSALEATEQRDLRHWLVQSGTSTQTQDHKV